MSHVKTSLFIAKAKRICGDLDREERARWAERLATEELRALWWKQPFASLMIDGKVETRTWDTKYRGLVLICASQKPYTLAELERISEKAQLVTAGVFLGHYGFTIQPPFDITGCAIAVGRLVQTNPMQEDEKTYVRHNPALFSHHYKDVHPIYPIPMKGQQGWKKIDLEFRKNIIFL